MPRAFQNEDESGRPEAARLWRVRRRHHHIDAIARPEGRGCQLQFVRNGRVLITRAYTSREAACAEADRRLRELQRAGWTTHW